MENKRRSIVGEQRSSPAEGRSLYDKAVLEETFAIFDTNGKGTLTADKVATFVKSAGYFAPNVKEIKARLDAAGQGKPQNLETFTRIVNRGAEASRKSKRERETGSDLEEALNVFDAYTRQNNKKAGRLRKAGTISLRDLQRALNKNGMTMNEDDFNALMAVVGPRIADMVEIKQLVARLARG